MEKKYVVGSLLVLALLIIGGMAIVSSNKGVHLVSPQNLQAIVQGESVKLTWQGVHDAIGYNIYRSTYPGELGVLVNDNLIKEESYIDSPIPGKVYYYTVRAVYDNDREDDNFNQVKAEVNAIPPYSLSIKINNDADFTNKKQVLLNVFALKATKCRFRNNDYDWSSYIPYSEFVNWNLSNDEGNVSVAMQCVRVLQDGRKIESKIVEDSIITDFTPPSVELYNVKLKDGDMTFSVDAEDNIDKDLDCAASIEDIGLATFKPNVTDMTLTLPKGYYNFYVTCVDDAGNSGFAVYPVNISKSTYNGTLPSKINMVINNDVNITNTRNVTLNFYVINANLTECRFANDNSYPVWQTPWLPFATNVSWTLSEDDGLKTVYAECRNENQSFGIIFDTIYYDNSSNYYDNSSNHTTPPSENETNKTITLLINGGAESTDNRTVNLKVIPYNVSLYICEFWNNETRMLPVSYKWEEIKKGLKWNLTSLPQNQEQALRTVNVECKDNDENKYFASSSITLRNPSYNAEPSIESMRVIGYVEEPYSILSNNLIKNSYLSALLPNEIHYIEDDLDSSSSYSNYQLHYTSQPHQLVEKEGYTTISTIKVKLKLKNVYRVYVWQEIPNNVDIPEYATSERTAKVYEVTKDEITIPFELVPKKQIYIPPQKVAQKKVGFVFINDGPRIIHVKAVNDNKGIEREATIILDQSGPAVSADLRPIYKEHPGWHNGNIRYDVDKFEQEKHNRIVLFSSINPDLGNQHGVEYPIGAKLIISVNDYSMQNGFALHGWIKLCNNKSNKCVGKLIYSLSQALYTQSFLVDEPGDYYAKVKLCDISDRCAEATTNIVHIPSSQQEVKVIIEKFKRVIDSINHHQYYVDKEYKDEVDYVSTRDLSFYVKVKDNNADECRLGEEVHNYIHAPIEGEVPTEIQWGNWEKYCGVRLTSDIIISSNQGWHTIVAQCRKRDGDSYVYSNIREYQVFLDTEAPRIRSIDVYVNTINNFISLIWHVSDLSPIRYNLYYVNMYKQCINNSGDIIRDKDIFSINNLHNNYQIVLFGGSHFNRPSYNNYRYSNKNFDHSLVLLATQNAVPHVDCPGVEYCSDLLDSNSCRCYSSDQYGGYGNGYSGGSSGSDSTDEGGWDYNNNGVNGSGDNSNNQNNCRYIWVQRGSYKLLTSTLRDEIILNKYIDRTLENGECYKFKLEAIDAVGHRSTKETGVLCLNLPNGNHEPQNHVYEK